MIKSFSRLRLEYIYLLLMLITGTILTFLTPVFQIPDEPNHFARAWQISESVFISPTEDREDGYTNLLSRIPAAFFTEKYIDNPFDAEKRYSLDDISEFISTPVNFNDTVTIQINNTGTYAPVVYFPQALAAYVVRNFTKGGGALLLLDEICSYIVCYNVRFHGDKNFARKKFSHIFYCNDAYVSCRKCFNSCRCCNK